MSRSPFTLSVVAGLIVAGLSWSSVAQAAPQGAGKMDVLDRGPVHEAFAEPFAMDLGDQTAQVIDRVPPDPVDELPPKIRPAGNNVKWIPGYWMWSAEVNDFVWVSGVWRQVPPGRQWTPGHWAKVAGGFQWISGFWTKAGAQQVRYLPQPPATLEAGPNIAAPGPNYFWIPGCWNWQQNRYAWRPGYWYQGQTNWLWIPDHYVYTPRGSIYVAGYWDYPLVNRGLLFAPVYWPGYVGNSILRYRPNYVLNSSLLLTGLTINNRYNHYYFGYANNYRQYGLSPWYNGSFYRRGGAFYDPFYAYHHWHDGRHNSNWQDRYHHHRHNGNHSHGNASDNVANNGGDRHQTAKPTLGGNTTRTLNNLIVPLGQVAKTSVTDVPLRRATDSQQRAALQQITHWQQLASQRKRAEKGNNHPNAGPIRQGQRGTPDVVRLGKSPQGLQNLLGSTPTQGNRILNNTTRNLGQTQQATGQGRPDVQPGASQPQDSNRRSVATQNEALRRHLQQQQQAVRDQRSNADKRVLEQQQAAQQHLQQQSRRYQPLQNRQHTLGQPSTSSPNSDTGNSDATNPGAINRGTGTQGVRSWQNFYRGRQSGSGVNSSQTPNRSSSPQRSFRAQDFVQQRRMYQPQVNNSPMRRSFQPQMRQQMQQRMQQPIQQPTQQFRGGGASGGTRTLNNQQRAMGR